MKQFRSTRAGALTALAAIGALALSACSAGYLGSSDNSSSGGAATTISFLVDNSEATMATGKALAEGFKASQNRTSRSRSRPDRRAPTATTSSRPSSRPVTWPTCSSTTRGSLLPGARPGRRTWSTVSDEPFRRTSTGRVQASPSPRTASVYGVPFGAGDGRRHPLQQEDLRRARAEVPKTWAEFMANNAKIKAAGVAPVIQTYGDTWTSQLFVLADFHNVAAQRAGLGRQVHREPGASTRRRRRSTGFQHLQEVTTRPAT